MYVHTMFEHFVCISFHSSASLNKRHFSTSIVLGYDFRSVHVRIHVPVYHHETKHTKELHYHHHYKPTAATPSHSHGTIASSYGDQGHHGGSYTYAPAAELIGHPSLSHQPQSQSYHNLAQLQHHQQQPVTVTGYVIDDSSHGGVGGHHGHHAVGSGGLTTVTGLVIGEEAVHDGSSNDLGDSDHGGQHGLSGGYETPVHQPSGSGSGGDHSEHSAHGLSGGYETHDSGDSSSGGGGEHNAHGLNDNGHYNIDSGGGGGYSTADTGHSSGFQPSTASYYRKPVNSAPHQEYGAPIAANLIASFEQHHVEQPHTVYGVPSIGNAYSTFAPQQQHQQHQQHQHSYNTESASDNTDSYIAALRHDGSSAEYQQPQQEHSQEHVYQQPQQHSQELVYLQPQQQQHIQQNSQELVYHHQSQQPQQQSHYHPQVDSYTGPDSYSAAPSGSTHLALDHALLQQLQDHTQQQQHQQGYHYSVPSGPSFEH